MSEKIQITITGVQALLEQGKSRKAIAEHYGISMADCKRLFMNPKLKGKKARKVEGDFILIDDTETDLLVGEAMEGSIAEDLTIENTVDVEAEVISEPTWVN